MRVFHVYLIKNLLLLFIAFLFPPFAYLLKKRWFVALGLLIIGFFGTWGYLFSVLLSLIAVIKQTIIDYKYREVHEANAQDDPFMRFLGKNFGLFNVERRRREDE